eukprot:g1511.t1
MGICGSSDAAANRRVEQYLAKDKQEEEIKLLLLGAGESGKSTFLKQLIQIHGKGFQDPSKRLPYKPIVFTNALISMKTLIREAKRLHDNGTVELPLEKQSEEANELISEIKDYTFFNPERAHAIKTLWADPAIKATYNNRQLFQLADECRWFFQRADTLAKEDYIPSYDDVLRCRARTVGIVETQFTVNNRQFRVLDMGGQRSERKKWVHCFEYVTGVLFVTAINEYDQVLYEDGATNRLHESLDLFQEICNSRWFKKAAMIVFLNKSDLFKEKIEKVDMNVCFDSYTGGKDYTAATDFLKDEFKSRAETLYMHITCATSTDNVTFTFNAVKDVVTKVGLSSMGLAI